MTTDRRPRTLLLFVALAVYMVLQTAWWAWLLVRKDRELEQLITAFELRPDEAGVPAVHAGRTLGMVIAEGSVFLALVLVALWLVYRAVRHELALARQQHDFLLAVSHELRTPIAGLKLHLQTLDRSMLDDAQRAELHQRTLADVERLGALTERVLLATRLEEPDAPMHLALHQLMPLVERITTHARSTYAKGHPLEVSGEALAARIDPAAFASVLENLLENAAKYSPAGSPIEVHLAQEGAHALMRVSDRGPGITPDDRQRIFGKFQRGGSEATRRAKGTGLGLYIVDRSMRRMGGGITFTPRPGGGSIFAASFTRPNTDTL